VLADALRPDYTAREDLLILALPRGGVPVAFEVAAALAAPLDVLLVRKLGLPRHKELAMGAIAAGGVQVLNQDLLRRLAIPRETIDAVVQVEQEELRRREKAFRGDRPPPRVKAQCVILVDDGLATGATMRAAVAAVRQQQPARVVVTVPVAPPDTVATLAEEADEVVCPAQPEAFMSVSQWYRQFPQTSETEVVDLLRRAWGD
jgi:putative phosphoribosyl transferase